VEQAFGTLGIDVRLGVGVKAVSPEGVTLENGDFMAAATTVWTGGSSRE
jgi:NADH dehydrogenase